MKAEKIADLGLLIASIIWGTTFFVLKNVVQFIDPIILCAYRFLFAALILLTFLVLKRESIFLNLRQGILLGIVLAVIYITQTIGIVYTNASNAAFITGLFVAFLPILSILFFKSIPSFSNTVAVVLSLCGLWILTGGMSNINKGDLITTITAFAYAFHILLVDRFVKKNSNPITLCFQQFLVVSIISFILAITFKLNTEIPKQISHPLVIYLIIFPTVIAFLLQLFCQKITSPIKVSLIFALETFFGALFAWTLGKEIFSLTTFVGGVLIVIGIIISEIKKEVTYLSLKAKNPEEKVCREPPLSVGEVEAKGTFF